MRLDSILHPRDLYRRYRLNGQLADFVRIASGCESTVCVYEALDSFLSSLLQYDRLAIRFADLNTGKIVDAFISGQGIPAWDQEATSMLAGTATEAVMRAGEPLIIRDCSDPAEIARLPILALSGAQLPSLLAVPLMDKGVPVGTIQLRSSKKGAFTERHAEAIQISASYIAPTVINSRQLAELQREVRERTVMAEIGRAASSTIDFGLVWDQFASTVKGLVPCDRLVLALTDDDSGSVSDRYVHGVPLPGWDGKPVRVIPGLPAQRVMLSRKAEISTAEENDQFSLRLMGYKMSERTGLRSAMFAPLIAGDRVIGTLNARTTQDHEYTN